MGSTIELRGFLSLQRVFKQRGWASPHFFELENEVSGAELLEKLQVPAEQVEVIFVNRKAYPCAAARIRPGDRVALAPPGVPGPYRVLLGFKNPRSGEEAS